MNELLELIEETKEWTGCRVKKEGELYRLLDKEVETIQSFINHIEMEGHRVYVHEGPEINWDTTFYEILAEIVHKNDLPEEEQWGYTVICDYDRD